MQGHRGVPAWCHTAWGSVSMKGTWGGHTYKPAYGGRQLSTGVLGSLGANDPGRSRPVRQRLAACMCYSRHMCATACHDDTWAWCQVGVKAGANPGNLAGQAHSMAGRPMRPGGGAARPGWSVVLTGVAQGGGRQLSWCVAAQVLRPPIVAVSVVREHRRVGACCATQGSGSNGDPQGGHSMPTSASLPRSGAQERASSSRGSRVQLRSRAP